MEQTIIIALGVLTVLLAAYILCKAVWVAGQARGFGSGYAEGGKARARRNARRRGSRKTETEKTT